MTAKGTAFVALLVTAAGIAWLAFNRVDRSAQDTGCHHPFRTGVRAVSPRLATDVDVGDDQRDVLARVLSDFARDRGWSFQNMSREEPGVLKALYLSACNDSLRVSVEEQRWARNDYAPAIAGRGVAVALYGDAPEGEWHAVASEIVAKLESQWPGDVRFLDRDGYFVERPSYLAHWAR